MASRASRIRQRRATIGLDYGTHSTKAVFRVRGEDLGQVLYFDDRANGYPNNATPSAIREKNGRLYFGRDALELSGGTYFGSLKADLYNASSESPEIQDEIFLHAAAYLSWSLSRLFDLYPEIREDNPVLQLSAPTSHTGPQELVQKYLHIANAVHLTATGAAPRITQGIAVDDARSILSPLLKAQMPSQGERRFFVMPETVAPIVSLQLEPLLEPGNYLVIDMGASTTEMSVFLVNDGAIAAVGKSILCYSDSTEFRGGNELERIQNLRIGTSREALQKFLKETEEQARRVWYYGFKYDQPSPATHERWKRIQIRLSGGGTLNKHFGKHVESRIDPISAWPSSETSKEFARHVPKTLECPRCEEEDLSFFAVANGLSVGRGLWPDFYDGAPPLEASPEDDEPLAPSYLDIG